MEGLILQGIGSFYTIWDGQEKYVCRAQKKLRRTGAPVPGDLCRFEPGTEGEDGWLQEILPRKNLLLRPAVANVDLLVLVIAPVPESDMGLVEKLLLYARAAEIAPILAVNKQDLDREMPDRIAREYRGTDLEVFGVSAQSGEGIDTLRARLEGRTVCFAGQSAVGKSSLLNALFDMNLETGGLSRKTDRGRHTTRRAELMILGQTRVMDTPGFSLLESIQMDPEEVPDLYPEYARFSPECRFQPCLHDREPGCAVRRAVEDGTLDPVRYARYRELLSEIRVAWKGRYN